MELEFWALAQNVLQTIVLGTLVVAIPALGLQAREWLKINTTADRHKTITDLAATTVMAIEQEYGQIDGSAKLAMAVKRMEQRLAEAGIKLELLELTMAIEAAVFEELHRWKPEPEEGEPIEILPVAE
jgi:hypothetical protein